MCACSDREFENGEQTHKPTCAPEGLGDKHAHIRQATELKKRDCALWTFSHACTQTSGLSTVVSLLSALT